MRNHAKLWHSGASEPSVGDKRDLLALYPVPCNATPHPFTQRTGWYWLQRVVQVRTITEGWVAYENDNPALRKLSDRTVFGIEALTVLALFACLAWAIYPLIVLFWPRMGG